VLLNSSGHDNAAGLRLSRYADAPRPRSLPRHLETIVGDEDELERCLFRHPTVRSGPSKIRHMAAPGLVQRAARRAAPGPRDGRIQGSDHGTGTALGEDSARTPTWAGFVEVPLSHSWMGETFVLAPPLGDAAASSRWRASSRFSKWDR